MPEPITRPPVLAMTLAYSLQESSLTFLSPLSYLLPQAEGAATDLPESVSKDTLDGRSFASVKGFLLRFSWVSTSQRS